MSIEGAATGIEEASTDAFADHALGDYEEWSAVGTLDELHERALLSDGEREERS